jgi:hypothetical protein
MKQNAHQAFRYSQVAKIINAIFLQIEKGKKKFEGKEGRPTGVMYPSVSYCLQPPETAKKNTITQGIRTSAHIFKSICPMRGFRIAPIKTSYMKLPDMRIWLPEAIAQK